MRRLIFLLSIFISVPAFAADRYQIIPAGTYGDAKRLSYFALRVDTQTGAFLWCNANMIWSTSPPQLVPTFCAPPQTLDGKPAPGLAAPAPHSSFTAPYFAFWSIQSENGAVSICAQSETNLSSNAPGNWYCASVPIKSDSAN
jgi:hypothetical protein